MTIDLDQVFAQHFERGDLEGAKKFARHWSKELKQQLPGQDIRDIFTQRAMAGHISDYLEGYDGTEPESYNGSGRPYYDTKYGVFLTVVM